MSKFWDKVMKCNHENLSPDYFGLVSCATPYCEGSETHCLDCGVYIVKCYCGVNNDMSGWPESRWRKYWRRKDKQREKLYATG